MSETIWPVVDVVPFESPFPDLDSYEKGSVEAVRTEPEASMPPQNSQAFPFQGLFGILSESLHLTF